MDRKQEKLIAYMQSVGQRGMRFAESLAYSKKYGVSPDFLRDAYSLIEKTSGRPGDGLTECIKDIDKDILWTSQFIQKWEPKKDSLFYSNAINDATIILEYLQGFKDVIDSVSPEELEDTKSSSKIGKAIRTRTHWSILIFVFLLIILIIILITIFH